MIHDLHWPISGPSVWQFSTQIESYYIYKIRVTHIYHIIVYLNYNKDLHIYLYTAMYTQLK